MATVSGSQTPPADPQVTQVSSQNREAPPSPAGTARLPEDDAEHVGDADLLSVLLGVLRVVRDNPQRIRCAAEVYGITPLDAEASLLVEGVHEWVSRLPAPTPDLTSVARVEGTRAATSLERGRATLVSLSLDPMLFLRLVELGRLTGRTPAGVLTDLAASMVDREYAAACRETGYPEPRPWRTPGLPKAP